MSTRCVKLTDRQTDRQTNGHTAADRPYTHYQPKKETTQNVVTAVTNFTQEESLPLQALAMKQYHKYHSIPISYENK